MFKTRQVAVMLAAGAALASATALTSCASTKTEPAKEENVIIGMANPFVDSATLEEAAALVGFSIELPSAEKLPEWATKIVYRSSTVNTKLLEIIYPADDTYTKEIRIRKAITDKEDMSGDYTSYEKEEIIILDEKTVNARFNGEKMYLTTWKDGEYSYSVKISDGANATDFEKLISVIK